MLHPFTKKDSRNLASSKPSPTSPCAKRGACHRTSDTLSSMGRQWHHFLPLNHGLVEEKIYSKATDLTTFFFRVFRFSIYYFLHEAVLGMKSSTWRGWDMEFIWMLGWAWVGDNGKWMEIGGILVYKAPFETRKLGIWVIWIQPFFEGTKTFKHILRWRFNRKILRGSWYMSPR